MNKLRICLICLMAFMCIGVNAQQKLNISRVIDSLMFDYDKRLRPNHEGAPVEVGVTLYVIGIHSLSEPDMEVTLDMYFRQYWIDPRLSFQKLPEFEYFTPGSDYGKVIWTPDTFFVNEKESYFHTVTTKNEFYRVHFTGSVTKSVRVSVTISCPMNFENYPMDKQICQLPIESYAYTMKDILFKWKDGDSSAQFGDVSTLPLFRVSHHNVKEEQIQLVNGNYSRLKLNIELQREMGYYVVQIYIPCFMLFILSWITFWLKHKATNVRLLICIAVLLSMIFNLQAINNLIPKTSYIKAIDVYTGVSMTMVFIALVEFAFVSNYSESDDVKTPKADNFFRIFHPIAFVIFNCIYFAIYC